MKVDLFMWTFNGEKNLYAVLAQIANVIPSESVGKRVVIDDHSTDLTRRIASSYGWTVVDNKLGGVASAFNQALDLAEQEYFCSFEQDLLLSEDWWLQVTRCLKLGDVLQGLRYTDNKIVRALEQLQDKKKVNSSFDNNIYRTEAIRKVGGAPNVCPICADANLKAAVEAAGFRWTVVFDVVSVHLHGGFWRYLGGQRKWWTRCTHKGDACFKTSLSGEVKRFLFSPVRGVQIAWRKKMWQLAFTYPILRATTLYYTLRYK